MLRVTGVGMVEVYMADNIAKTMAGEDAVAIGGVSAANAMQVGPAAAVAGRLHGDARGGRQGSIRANVGARPWDRDAIDTRIVDLALSGSGAIIDSEADVGGYPVMTPTQAPFVDGRMGPALHGPEERHAVAAARVPAPGWWWEPDRSPGSGASASAQMARATGRFDGPTIAVSSVMLASPLIAVLLAAAPPPVSAAERVAEPIPAPKAQLEIAAIWLPAGKVMSGASGEISSSDAATAMGVVPAFDARISRRLTLGIAMPVLFNVRSASLIGDAP